ncbi:unnamed protein product [Sphenostylis stenocarpa]|uniref:Uncharacterized protein n=1 Tax=Sphenostylis stenocarpa TaxID=92480 RepID=A0AA86VZP0_9FABA|nr:unnamed protein product [Sphenostylis stenocarpa]
MPMSILVSSKSLRAWEISCCKTCKKTGFFNGLQRKFDEDSPTMLLLARLRDRTQENSGSRSVEEMKHAVPAKLEMSVLPQ